MGSTTDQEVRSGVIFFWAMNPINKIPPMIPIARSFSRKKLSRLPFSSIDKDAISKDIMDIAHDERMMAAIRILKRVTILFKVFLDRLLSYFSQLIYRILQKKSIGETPIKG